MARPRKPAAIRALEGNRSRTEIPKELPLHGLPTPTCALDRVAQEHFDFYVKEFGGCGVLKAADSAALTKLADLWSRYWSASEAGEIGELLKLSAAWDRLASKLGLMPVDRSRLLVAQPEKADETEERFFKVTG